VQGLITIDNVAYGAAASSCNGTPDSVVALDLTSKEVQTFKPSSGNIAGTMGPAIGPDGVVYVTTTQGELLALEPKTLKLKDTYKAGEAFVSSPVIFESQGKTLIAAATKSSIHVIDAAAPGTAVAKANGSGSVLSTWQDSAGTRWLLAPSDNTITAWKVAGDSLQPGWTSRDITSPLPPTIVNGVVLAASTGSSPVLYALDGSTGKEMWNSGKSIASAIRSGGISVGNSQVYVGANDGTVYVFGFPIEH